MSIIGSEEAQEYILGLEEERKNMMHGIRNEILKNIDSVCKETFQSGMIHYVIPLSVYPNGYHCTPNSPLPFVSLANQKNYVSLYDMALYDQQLEEWWKTAYEKEIGKKPDMGKCCIRFKKEKDIPATLVGELIGKVSAKRWIDHYEETLHKKKK